MIDPCNPPATIAQLGLTDQTYTITQTEITYVHEGYTIDPSYCEVTKSYTVEAFANGSTGVTEPSNDDDTFKIFYDTDLLPIAPVD
jgi:hypothetical protein